MRALFMAGAIACLCAATPASRATQEPVGPSPPIPPIVGEDLPPGFPGGDPRGALLELFEQVEKDLAAIDDLLSDAAAGDDPGQRLADALLASDQVVAGIDKILATATASSSGSPSGSSGSSGSSGQSPSQPGSQMPPTPGGEDGEQGKPEETPASPEESRGQGGEKPEEGQGGDKPEDNEGQDNDSGRNQQGLPPENISGQPVAPGTDADRWGNLPVRVREVYENQKGDDVPVVYREWIDAYYRRIGGTSSRTGSGGR